MTEAGVKDKAQTISADGQTYPSRVYAWFVVGVLSVAYCLSLLDRWIMSLLVAPMKAHFHLTDTSMGLLMGPVFAMTYIVMGLPFGWLADRSNRRNLIAGAVAFWSLMTVACGLARSTPQLICARLGIGVGEAALSPAANSIIADYFPRHLQSRAIGVYGLGVYGGQGLAYLIGALIVAWATTLSQSGGWAGGFEPFQLVFIIVGIPGLVVSLLLLATVREPRRTQVKSLTGAEASNGRCIAYWRANWRTFLPLSVGMGAVPLVGFMKLWLPTLFSRTWGWDVKTFGLTYGIMLLILGPIGAVASGYLSGWINSRARKDGPYLVMLIAAATDVVCGCLMPLAPSPQIAMALLAPAAIFGSMATVSGIAATVYATPGEFRGRILASYTIINGTIGVFAGPAAAGFLNDAVFTAADGIRLSMSTLCGGAGGALLVLLYLGLKPYGRTVANLEASLGSGERR